MAQVLADYERHLAVERDLTEHTVRAYLADVRSLLEHAARLGDTNVSELDLRTLRSWLAKQQTLGRSRTTIARRATAARGAAHRRGHRPDPGGHRGRGRRQPGGAARHRDARAPLRDRHPGRRDGR